MSQSINRDLEVGSEPDGHHDPRSASNQPLQGESNFGDSSGKLFSIYSNVAKDEDNKMVERWQKDADGILIFTGLFSAAVAALLSVTVQDLRPNSQDTSAFYLGNIYGVLADPNATRPSPIAKPPPFSRPRYAVWVNSLWFLSLVMSLSCALWATSLHQWARRYIRHTQPERCSPERRARRRAFFANGVEKMHIPWAVEGLPALLHLSLFLFFNGLAIFLFNVDQEVFIWVGWWIGLFSVVYVLITMLPLIRHDSPYYTPLSILAWFPYATIQYVAFTYTRPPTFDSPEAFDRYFELKNRYLGRILGGMEKAAEETASEQSSDIDIGILGWTISVLGDDDSLEKFFEALPGFFDSKLVKDFRQNLSYDTLRSLSNALHEFLDRTLSSNSVIGLVKRHRLDISLNTINMLGVSSALSILEDILIKYWHQLPQTFAIEDTLARWCNSNDRHTAEYAQVVVGRALTTARERNDRLVGLAVRVYGLSERDIRDYITHGDDSALFAILIQITRKVFRSGLRWTILRPFTEFNKGNTFTGLQHDFCTLWNEIVQEARNQGRAGSIPTCILQEIRHHYIAFHQGTDASLTACTPSTAYGRILFEPSSYPSCNVASHRPDSIVYTPVPFLTQHASVYLPDASHGHSTSGCSTVARIVQEPSAVAGPPSPSHLMTLSVFGDSSPAPAATSPALPVHTTPRPSDASPSGVVFAALQDIRAGATLSHLMEGATQRDVDVSCTEPGILSAASMTAPTPALASVPTLNPPVLNLGKSLESYDAGSASASRLSLSASSVVGFSIPASPPPSRAPPLPNAEFLSLLGSTAPFLLTENATLPRLRARGLVNTGRMCFANAVLQLLVHSPSFWNLFREVAGLKGPRGVGGLETGGGATPLVDATVRFLEEFVFKEEPPPPQQAAGGKPREGEDATEEHNAIDSFEPMYIYDVMKEKRRLKSLLDGQQRNAEEFFRLYLDSLDEELLALLASISGHKSATATPRVEEREVSQPSQTDMGKRFMAKSVESPLLRIFGGKVRSTVRAPSQPNTVTIEEWKSLQLDIQHDLVHTIEDALARISHPLPVQLGPSGSEASQQVLIEALPSILVLHLKRFLYDTATNSMSKIRKPIQFTPELEIPLEIMAPVAGKSEEPVHYKLYGVLYHHGKSAGSGHYTVDVLRPNGDTRDSGNREAWLHIDDEAVSVTRNEEVFGRGSNELVDDRCVYMLFYYCTAPTQT